MTKFFKKIRQNLFPKSKLGKYLLYAVGEIILVVFGILIAIQINNWKQLNAEKELEKKYLKNLVHELEQDAAGLEVNFHKLQNQARTKNTLLSMIREGVKGDSIITYFEYQWFPIPPYIPIRSTYIEMTTNSHLRIIKDDLIRGKIIKLYNAYEGLEKEEDFMTKTATGNVLNLISKRMPNMSNYTVDDVMSLKSHTHVLNAIQLNGAYTRRSNYSKVLEKCFDLIKEVETYRTTLE